MKKIIIIFLIFTSCIFQTYKLYSQNNFEGKPYTFENNIKDVNEIKSFQKSLPSFPILNNIEEQTKADEYSLNSGQALYGKNIDFNIDFKEYAKEYEVKDGKLYLLSIQSPDAYGLQVRFDAFTLPEGSEMFIYSKDKSKYIGGYNSKSAFNNTFVTTFLWSDSLTIEYYEPFNVESQSNIHIHSIVHIFKDLNPESKDGKDFGDAGQCTKDVACTLGTGWKSEISSVCMILYSNGSYVGLCSGVLLNNPFIPKKAIVLSASHCFSGVNPWYWNFVFNYQKTGCASGNPTTGYNVYGADTKAIGADLSTSSDFLVLELPDTFAGQSILKQNGIGYSGWDTRENYSTSTTANYIGISHPKGDVKKIAQSTMNGVVTEDPFAGFSGNNYWKITWAPNMGVQEGGASGSPLYNPAHKIIGQLKGGVSGCNGSSQNSTPWDYYGKLSSTWHLGTGGKGNTLADILTDGDESITSMGGYNASMEHCYNGSQDGGETGMDCGGPDCEPCDYVNQNYDSEPCSNGVMDGDETGIDCGYSCMPCGFSCNNGKKDGDETGIDCGGSCVPCDMLCSTSGVTYTGSSTIPDITKSSDYITTSGTLTVGAKTFQAKNTVTLSPGFTGTNGFVANIRYCKCGGMSEPVPVDCNWYDAFSNGPNGCRQFYCNAPNPKQKYLNWNIAAVTN